MSAGADPGFNDRGFGASVTSDYVGGLGGVPPNFFWNKYTQKSV